MQPASVSRFLIRSITGLWFPVVNRKWVAPRGGGYDAIILLVVVLDGISMFIVLVLSVVGWVLFFSFGLSCVPSCAANVALVFINEGIQFVSKRPRSVHIDDHD